MIPFEVIDRVFKISSEDGEGTDFMLDISGRQYLITAKHVVSDLSTTYLRLFHDHAWKGIRAVPVGQSDVDIAVFALPYLIAHPQMVLETAVGGFFSAQEVFFAGFPLGLEMAGVDSLYPMPLVKKAIISGAAPGGIKAPFYLDGNVNHGFSGGPVYLKIPGTQKFVVSMVISSFVGTPEPVFVAADQQPADDDIAHPRQYILANSGIIRAFSIKNALDLIAENPIGHPTG
jgi:hypothetical protein